MSSARLPTWVWVDALRRRAEAQGAFVMVVRRGDLERGQVLLQVLGPGRLIELFGAARTAAGEPAFARVLSATRPEGEPVAEQRIAREIASDPDVWIVEISDAAGRHFLTEPVLEM